MLKEIVRVLKPGSHFSMVDIKGTSNAYEDKKTLGGANSAGQYVVSKYVHFAPSDCARDIKLSSSDSQHLSMTREQSAVVHIVIHVLFNFLGQPISLHAGIALLRRR